MLQGEDDNNELLCISIDKNETLGIEKRDEGVVFLSPTVFPQTCQECKKAGSQNSSVLNPTVQIASLYQFLDLVLENF